MILRAMMPYSFGPRSFLRARGPGDVIGHDLPSLCDLVKITAEELLEK